MLVRLNSLEQLVTWVKNKKGYKMFTAIGAFFSNTKNIIMAILAMLIGGYVIKQKYTAYKAEDKLKTIENKIAKTNVAVAKQIAKAKAKSKEIEHTTEVEVLRELQSEKKKVLEEMDTIEAQIEKSKEEKTKVTGRTKGEKFKVSV